MITDLLFILGLALIDIGAFLIARPIGFIVTGISLLVLAYILVQSKVLEGGDKE